MTDIFILFYALMIASALLGSWFYIKSCMPAALEKQVGPISYQRCAKLRYYSSMCLSLSFMYFFCYNFPELRSGILWLDYFSWNYWISFGLAIAIFIPGIMIFKKGRKDLGVESDAPKEYHKVVSTGIYAYVRHPQLLGEILFWYAISFLMHAPILALTATLFWIPLYVVWCVFEEKDLVARYGDEYVEYRKKTKFLIPFIL